MITDIEFWETIVSSWIFIQTTEEKEQVISFAQELARKEATGNGGKVKSLIDELLEEDE